MPLVGVIFACWQSADNATSSALKYRADVASRDHGDPGDAPSVPPPLTDVANAVRPSAAEEARTIAASTNTGTLATLTATGDPWASFVTYGLLDGAPVLCVSNMAEHGRNLARRSARQHRDRRARHRIRTRWRAGG